MATVESSDMEVVVELGVPLDFMLASFSQTTRWGAYGTSEGVTGSEGGGGRLIKVGAFDMAAAEGECAKCGEQGDDVVVSSDGWVQIVVVVEQWRGFVDFGGRLKLKSRGGGWTSR